MNLASFRTRLAVWLARWRPVLPLFGAEVIVWVGFGALLPVIPLYFTQEGVDLATLGVVVAAWPAARLVGEPVFGWIADRAPRVPLMVAGLALSSVFLALPLAVHGAVAFLLLRALAGLSTALYDPAARGLLMDAMPPERHGEAFGWYGAAQMAGLLLGPAIGGFGAGVFGGIGFGFVFSGILGIVAAVAVATTVRDVPHRGSVPALPGVGVVDFPRGIRPIEEWPSIEALVPAPIDSPVGDRAPARSPLPKSLRNRPLAAAVIANTSANYGGGTYDVIWSLFLTAKGASLGLVSLTFTMWAVPVLLFGPAAGRAVDRRGGLRLLVLGMVMTACASFAYTIMPDVGWSIPIILFEASGFAILYPALYAIVGRGSPEGRSSTAQGVFGGAGTLGFVIASLVTGTLAGIDLRYPFYLCSLVTLVCLGLALAVGRRAILAGEPGAMAPPVGGAAVEPVVSAR
jgi:DHA1 family multidrug resistance protein-like MFS transporter